VCNCRLGTRNAEEARWGQGIRVCDADGGLVSRLGGAGQGPGEFASISGAGWWRGTRDTVWVFDLTGRMNLFTSDGRFARSVTARRMDYGDRLRIDRPGVILPDGQALSLAAYQPAVGSNQDDPRVRVTSLSTSGDTLWDRRFGYSPDRIPQSEVDSILRYHVEGFQRFAALDASLSEADAERAYRQAIRIPDHRPPVAGAWVDRDGRMWLQWSAAPGLPGELWMLNSEGDPVARLTPPRRLTIQAVDREFLWATETDELDIPYLVRYRISPEGRS